MQFRPAACIYDVEYVKKKEAKEKGRVFVHYYSVPKSHDQCQSLTLDKRLVMT